MSLAVPPTDTVWRKFAPGSVWVTAGAVLSTVTVCFAESSVFPGVVGRGAST